MNEQTHKRMYARTHLLSMNDWMRSKAQKQVDQEKEATEEALGTGIGWNLQVRAPLLVPVEASVELGSPERRLQGTSVCPSCDSAFSVLKVQLLRSGQKDIVCLEGRKEGWRGRGRGSCRWDNAARVAEDKKRLFTKIMLAF